MKIAEIIFFFVIFAFELVAGIFVNYEENTCYRQSPCLQGVLRFLIRFKSMFSNSICLGLKENSDRSPGMQMWAVFGSRECGHSGRLS